MNLSDFSVNRPVGILMIVAGLVVVGIVSLTELAIDLLPDIDYPMVAVMTQYEGVAPQEIETLVTEPLEGTISTIDRVNKVSSISKSGLSTIMVEFNWDTNMDIAAQDVREKIGIVEDLLPDDVGKSFVMKLDISAMPIMFLGLTGDLDMDELKKIAKDYLKPNLEGVDGVATAQVMGGRTKEILIEVDQSRLAAHDLSLQEVGSALRVENLNMAGGRIDLGKKENLVRTVGEFTGVAEIAETVVSLRGGSPVRLRDVAQVLDTYKEERSYVRMNGRPAVAIMVMKQSGTNTAAIAREIHERLDEMRSTLPPDVQLIEAFDMSVPITQSLKAVRINAIWGGIFAVIILFFFLHNIRSTVIIGVAIPVCVITTFTLMYFLGITFNMMSLGGFALALGILVDNSIIVLENIFRHLQERKDRMTAARTGATEVGMAVAAATFTTIVVFLPIAYVHGLAGQLFRDLALTVGCSLAASLFLALTLVPMLSSKFLATARYREGAILSWLKTSHDVALEWALDHRAATLAIAFLLFLTSIALVASPLVGKDFLPGGFTPGYLAMAKTPPGTTFAESKARVSQLEGIMADAGENKALMAALGVSDVSKYDAAMGMITDVNEAELFVLMEEPEREVVERIIEEVRTRAANEIPGLEARISSSGDAMLMESSQASIVIKVIGRDLNRVLTLSQQVADEIELVRGVRDVSTSFRAGKGEFQVKVDRQKAAAHGLQVATVATTLQTAIQGQVATRLRREGEEIDIRVRLKEDDRDNVADLLDLTLPLSFGVTVPLGDLVEVHRGTSPSEIRRENQRRVIEVTASTAGRGVGGAMDMGRIMQDVRARLSRLTLPTGYTLEYGGDYKRMMDAFLDLAKALVLAILLVYMVLAFLFDSLVHPFSVMFAVPLASVGVALGLLLGRQPLCVTSGMGMVMLTGIVVNDAIILVDYINQLRGRDMERRAAILLGGQTRLRPIVLTTVTTVLALSPTAMGFGGDGSAMMRPLAVAVIGGLLTATMLTLLIIPVVYSLVDDVGLWLRRKLRREEQLASTQSELSRTIEGGSQ